jgi:hypothetical protein
MPRRIDKVQLIPLTVPRSVCQRHALRLDSNTAFSFNIHGIEYLSIHFALTETAAELDKTIGDRRLSVIDMRYDRKIADMTEI